MRTLLKHTMLILSMLFATRNAYSMQKHWQTIFCCCSAQTVYASPAEQQKPKSVELPKETAKSVKIAMTQEEINTIVERNTFLEAENKRLPHLRTSLQQKKAHNKQLLAHIQIQQQIIDGQRKTIEEMSDFYQQELATLRAPRPSSRVPRGKNSSNQLQHPRITTIQNEARQEIT